MSSEQEKTPLPGTVWVVLNDAQGEIVLRCLHDGDSSDPLGLWVYYKDGYVIYGQRIKVRVTTALKETVRVQDNGQYWIESRVFCDPTDAEIAASQP